MITHDINIISNFSKLRILEIYRVELNGRYPVLFNFPLLHRGSSEYAKYTAKINEIEDEVDIYEGFHKPPTEEEYRRLVEG